MASMTFDERKQRWQIQAICRDGARRSLYLRLPADKVRKISAHVARLSRAARGLLPLDDDDETLLWLKGKQGRALRPKLERMKLIEPLKAEPKPEAVTLGKWVADYLATRSDLKQASHEGIRFAGKSLTDFFGKDRQLASVSPGDADEFRLHLIRQKLAQNTVNRRMGRAKQLFRAAVRKRVIEMNPFDGFQTAVTAREKPFISRATLGKLLDHAPDDEWRLIVLLSRICGLRCSSEVMALQIADVLFDQHKVIVRSPKTAHHPGKDQRIIPLFPEAESLLLKACTEAEAGDIFVIRKHRLTRAALRGAFKRIITAAGLEPWVSPFHSMRASRQIELEESYPSHVVCAWLGNTEPIARKNYLRPTERHFEQATGGASSAESSAHSVTPRDGTSQKTESATPCDALPLGKTTQNVLKGLAYQPAFGGKAPSNGANVGGPCRV